MSSAGRDTRADVVEHNGTRYRLDDLASALDDQERDAVHLDLAPCDAQVWWDEFRSRYPASADAAAMVSPVQEG